MGHINIVKPNKFLNWHISMIISIGNSQNRCKKNLNEHDIMQMSARFKRTHAAYMLITHSSV